jgi:hypothetical protein
MMPSMRRLLVGLMASLASALALASSASASPYPECISDADAQHVALTQPALSKAKHVRWQDPATGVRYVGDAFAPKSAAGRRPMALVMHGINSNPCSVRWLARYLAAHGYVSFEVYRRPTPDVGAAPVRGQAILHMKAVKAAVAYMRSPSFVYAGRVDRKRLALTGHSLGSSAISVMQSKIPDVQAVVAMDNLKKYAAYDPSNPFSCTGTQYLLATPKVPALSFGSEVHCPDPGADTSPEVKKSGYNWWHQQSVPAAELVMAGFVHQDFAASGSDEELNEVATIALPWLDHWLRGIGTNPLTGLNRAWLSTQFTSAAYLPANGIDCADLSTC